ncbi:hypothetical protein M0R45_032250 [Rubus argutus]|uniref:F-box domain-containing protein n=1 Tax=Rubus argutus TaxID=59490 RepID=A0AAW1WKJ2_RUBAR
MKRKTLTDRSRTVPSDLIIDNTNIDDLPEVLLVEILCRLPCNKLVFQCKCVSKRWFSLISSSQSFVGRYLCIQHELQKPINLTTLVVLHRGSNSLFTTSDHPVFKTKAATSNFTLGFFPCYQAEAIPKMAEGTCYPWNVLKEGSIIPPVVVGTYKDLVLCCATKYNQRDYYLCNPYTKEWARLPPTPQVYHTVAVALVCEPYYKCEQGSIILNSEYRWKVVRAVPNSSDPNFHLEIFYSETHQWRELAVLCSQPFSSFFCVDSSSVMAYNGMLYWWRCDGFMLELDLSMFTTSTCSSGDHNIAKCRFIELPEDLKVSGIPHLVVSQGRLLMYMYMLLAFDDEDLHSIKVWELKQVVEDNSIQDKFKWLVDSLSLTSEVIPLMRPKNGRHRFNVIAFHQNSEDTVYIYCAHEIVTCNLHGGKLEAATKIRILSLLDFCYPFVLPWWPTPIPKL